MFDNIEKSKGAVSNALNFAFETAPDVFYSLGT